MSSSPIRADSRTLIAGIGSALVDILLQESDAFLASSGAHKGGMTLTGNDAIEAVVRRSASQPQIVPGGSACNTIVGVGMLGGPARFVGKCGRDDLGRLFEDQVARSNVEPVIFKTDAPTGRVLSIVTPDAQRSMLTFLGASSETRPEEITAERFRDAAIVHIEGYLLFNEALMWASLKAARSAGALVSLDLASFTVVEASKAILPGIIREYVDIIIANEDESRAYTGEANEEKALAVLSEQADIAVVKIGKRGSLVSHKGAVTRIARMGSGSAVDTTGAGDLWAGGFLYGLAHGYGIEAAGTIASACGYEVCQVVGAQIPPEGWARIRKLL